MQGKSNWLRLRIHEIYHLNCKACRLGMEGAPNTILLRLEIAYGHHSKVSLCLVQQGCSSICVFTVCGPYRSNYA